jgi:hypothetical protein
MIERRHPLARSGTGWARRVTRVGAVMLIVALSGGGPAISIDPAAGTRAVAGVAKRSLNAWSPPELIAGHDLGTGLPAPVAFDSSGDAFVVFDEPILTIKESISLSYLVRAAVRPAGGHWQTPDTLSHLGLDPEVAVDGQGEAIAVWQSPSSVEESERPAGGSWLSPKAVLMPGGGEPQVATNARGDAIVVSRRQAPHHSSGIEIAMRSAGGAFSPPQMISGAENAFEPRVAMNARGDALVAWRVDTGYGCPVHAALHRAGRGWNRPRTVSDPYAFCESGNHRVAIDEHGDAIVVWFAQRGRPLFVEEATTAANGRWSARRLLAKARTVERPEVGMDARGDAIVAWWQEWHEWTRVRPAGRRWKAARMVANSRGLPASLAVDQRGDALLAWRARGGISAAAKRSTETNWQTSVVAVGRGTALAEPIAAIDARGDGAVAWLTDKGLNTAWNGSVFTIDSSAPPFVYARHAKKS